MNCRSQAPERNPTTRWKTSFSIPANAGKGMEPAAARAAERMPEQATGLS
jgi:hypothetical protein